MSMTTTDPDQLLTAEQVASRLQVDKSWVYHAARESMLPSVRCGRWVRFRPADIERFIAHGGVEE